MTAVVTMLEKPEEEKVGEEGDLDAELEEMEAKVGTERGSSRTRGPDRRICAQLFASSSSRVI